MFYLFFYFSSVATKKTWQHKPQNIIGRRGSFVWQGKFGTTKFQPSCSNIRIVSKRKRSEVLTAKSDSNKTVAQNKLENEILLLKSDLHNLYTKKTLDFLTNDDGLPNTPLRHHILVPKISTRCWIWINLTLPQDHFPEGQLSQFSSSRWTTDLTRTRDTKRSFEAESFFEARSGCSIHRNKRAWQKCF